MAKIFFYYAAMNAGKSTILMQASHNYNERGMSTLLFAPAFDDRFGDPAIYSRIGLKKDAILFDQEFNLFEFVGSNREKYDKLKCILIDEAQFLTKAQVAQVIMVTKEYGIAALCYGLRSDFLGEPFEGSKYLLAWADELIEIKTICHCGSKATMNMRIDCHGVPVTSGSQVQVGGNESYLSVCMKHFIEKVGILDEYFKQKEGAHT